MSATKTFKIGDSKVTLDRKIKLMRKAAGYERDLMTATVGIIADPFDPDFDPLAAMNSQTKIAELQFEYLQEMFALTDEELEEIDPVDAIGIVTEIHNFLMAKEDDDSGKA